MKKAWFINIVCLVLAATQPEQAIAAGGFTPGHLFAGGSISDNVVELDPVTGSTIRTLSSPEHDGIMSTAFGPDGNLFLASGLSNQIFQFKGDGTLVGSFSTPNGPSGVAFGPNGNLFVTIFGELDLKTFVNTPDNRIIEYTTSGKLIQTITHATLLGPAGITIDKSGIIYVTVANTAEPGTPGQAVLKFSMSGQLLQTITHAQLDGALGVGVNTAGDIFVSSFFDDAVLVFDSQGTLIDTIQHVDLDGPTYHTIDSEGNLYVSSLLNDKIVIFDSTRNHLRTISSGSLDGPYGLAIAPSRSPIPTVSEWGLIVLTLLGMTAGTIILARRRRPATAPG